MPWTGLFDCISNTIKLLYEKEHGKADRIIRILAAIVFAVLYFTNTVTGTWGIVLLVLGGVFVLTSFVGFCPGYAIFGMDTCPAKGTTRV